MSGSRGRRGILGGRLWWCGRGVLGSLVLGCCGSEGIVRFLFWSLCRNWMYFMVYFSELDVITLNGFVDELLN